MAPILDAAPHHEEACAAILTGQKSEPTGPVSLPSGGKPLSQLKSNPKRGPLHIAAGDHTDLIDTIGINPHEGACLG
jgi:hypothetical protein